MPSREERFPDKSREAIREAARKYEEADKIPPEKFPGEKWFHQTNLVGYLGGFAVPLLDALEKVEAASQLEQPSLTPEDRERLERIADTLDQGGDLLQSTPTFLRKLAGGEG